ncbi:MAG TPA: hypothetical protein VMT58_09890, partial [Candidatus Binataceae bacterium]|nr:hypothetical protein [Candidatus Binataceae bacterium]
MDLLRQRTYRFLKPSIPVGSHAGDSPKPPLRTAPWSVTIKSKFNQNSVKGAASNGQIWCIFTKFFRNGAFFAELSLLFGAYFEKIA